MGTIRKHCLNILSTVGIILIFVILFVGIYWLFIQPDVIDVKDFNAFTVDKTVYHPGDRITYTFSYCKSRKTLATVDRALIDTYRITYATVYSDLPIGCHTINKNDLVIPEFIAGEGKAYHLEGTAIYPVNPLRNQYVYFRTVDFIIK